MRRPLISLLVVPVMLLALAAPAFATTVTVEKYTAKYLGLDAYAGDCSTLCTEYVFRAGSRTDNVGNFVCIEIDKWDHGAYSTERGCRYPASDPIHRTGLLSAGRATLTVDPLNITLDSGRIVRVSGTATSKGLLAEPGSDAGTIGNCTILYRWTKWDTENSPATSVSSLTIGARTLVNAFVHLGVVKHKNTTTCP